LGRLTRTVAAEFIGLLAITYWIFSLRIFRIKRRCVLSIYFHNPSVYIFIAVTKFLMFLGFNFISIRDLKGYLTGRKNLGKNCALITFDDAWRDNLKLGFIIDKMELPICLFVPTEPVEKGEFWWEQVKRFEGFKASNTINQLKEVSNKRRLSYISKLPKTTKTGRDAMSWSELLNFRASDYVTIGSHSKTHPLLDKCNDRELFEELAGSKIILEEITGENVDAFAYPNGNFDDRVLEMASSCGYCIAFTTKPGLITRESHPMQLPRYSINDNGLFFENIAKAIGAWQYIFWFNYD